ncbi:MAG: hypothetical protein D6816_10060 [Bacteroidetes bacterium]|nr:MAG: hypothetical protein D6816_10060 [Bacteroidota bacterium]
MGLLDDYPYFYRGVNLVDLIFGLITLRQSDVPICIDDNGTITQYEGKVVGRLNVKNEALEFRDDFRDLIFSVDLSNIDLGAGDSRIEDTLLGLNIYNGYVNVYHGIAGDTKSDYILMFYGSVDVDRPIFLKPDVVTLSFKDVFSSVELPYKHFSYSDYDEIESEAVGKVIPWVIGDFSTDTDGMYLVRAWWIGDDTWKIADHALTSVDSVIAVRGDRWKEVDFSADLPNGEVYIFPFGRADGDKVYVKCKGLPKVDGSGVASTPSEVVDALLLNMFNIGLFGNKADYGDKVDHIQVRRLVTSEEHPMDLLQSLARETVSVVSVRFPSEIRMLPHEAWYGRLQSEQDAMKRFEDYDIISYKRSVDNDRLYASKMKWRSNDGWYSGEEDVGAGRVVSTDMEFKWVYNPADMIALCRRELMLRNDRGL